MNVCGVGCGLDSTPGTYWLTMSGKPKANTPAPTPRMSSSVTSATRHPRSDERRCGAAAVWAGSGCGRVTGADETAGGGGAVRTAAGAAEVATFGWAGSTWVGAAM